MKARPRLRPGHEPVVGAVVGPDHELGQVGRDQTHHRGEGLGVRAAPAAAFPGRHRRRACPARAWRQRRNRTAHARPGAQPYGRCRPQACAMGPTRRLRRIPASSAQPHAQRALGAAQLRLRTRPPHGPDTGVTARPSEHATEPGSRRGSAEHERHEANVAAGQIAMAGSATPCGVAGEGWLASPYRPSCVPLAHRVFVEPITRGRGLTVSRLRRGPRAAVRMRGSGGPQGPRSGCVSSAAAGDGRHCPVGTRARRAARVRGKHRGRVR
ncbi:hypothetical protein BX257_9208 [Streptomyces sp. 3212.3]|nr:hypothetical protein BX257_9208 [Streptomyces sp. 3212.3]